MFSCLSDISAQHKNMSPTSCGVGLLFVCRILCRVVNCQHVVLGHYICCGGGTLESTIYHIKDILGAILYLAARCVRCRQRPNNNRMDALQCAIKVGTTATLPGGSASSSGLSPFATAAAATTMTLPTRCNPSG